MDLFGSWSSFFGSFWLDLDQAFLDLLDLFSTDVRSNEVNQTCRAAFFVDTNVRASSFSSTRMLDISNLSAKSGIWAMSPSISAETKARARGRRGRQKESVRILKRDMKSHEGPFLKAADSRPSQSCYVQARLRCAAGLGLQALFFSCSSILRDG